VTPLESQVRPVLERIEKTMGRVGMAELAGTDPDALKAARAHRLVSSNPYRGWYLTDKGAAFLLEIQQKGGNW
jgi:hypothetical protein